MYGELRCLLGFLRSTAPSYLVPCTLNKYRTRKLQAPRSLRNTFLSTPELNCMNMAGTKPTILLVHGAWHGPHHLQSFVELLESSGFKVVTPDLPSVGVDPPTPDQTEDIKTIRNAIVSIIDDGSDCLVGLHSYAGVPGSSALEGLGKTQRNEIGKKGGVTGLVYFPAWVMPKGKSLVPKGGPYSPDWDIQVPK